jgi:hypothetical protein
MAFVGKLAAVKHQISEYKARNQEAFLPFLLLHITNNADPMAKLKTIPIAIKYHIIALLLCLFSLSHSTRGKG